MNDQRQGHLPTLFACFLHFDLSFMLWVLLGALGVVHRRETCKLRAPASVALLVALPISERVSLLRIPVGLLERPARGARRAGGRAAGLPVRAADGRLAARRPALWPAMLAVGLDAGRGEAPRSRWRCRSASALVPARERQGLALGIAAAGNSGTVITNLVAPRLAERWSGGRDVLRAWR